MKKQFLLLLLLFSLANLIACSNYNQTTQELVDDKNAKQIHTVPVPNYYNSYLPGVISKIKTAISSGSAQLNGNDSFLFITDTHIQSNALMSPLLAREILRATDCKMVVLGGDIISAYGTKDEMLAENNSQIKSFDLHISPLAKIFSIRGNHDFTVRTSPSDASGYTFSQQETRKMLMMRDDGAAKFNEVDPSGCYYYYDNTFQKIRYISLDTSDSVIEGNSWGNIYGVGKTQMDWIVSNAVMTTPSGYNIVFISHIPVTDTTGDSGGYEKFTNVLSLIESINNKAANVVINEVTYDFSNISFNVIMTLSGHMHNDLQTYKNGVLHIVTACDAYYNDYRYSPFFNNPPYRVKGSITEQLFDFFHIDVDNKVIKVIRVGAGYDRMFNTEKKTILVNNNITLISRLTGTLTWNSYNSIGNKKSGNIWTMKNDIVSVSNGVVSGLKSGEAVVFAMDSNQNKEFFYIQVIHP